MAIGMYMDVHALNKMYGYKYEELRECSFSLPEYLIYTWEFIVNLKLLLRLRQ